MEKVERQHIDVLVTWSELRDLLKLAPEVEYLNMGVHHDSKVPDPRGELTQIVIQGFVPVKPSGIVGV